MYFDLLATSSGEHVEVVRDLDTPIDDMLLNPPGPFHHPLPTMGEGAVLFLDARYDLAALQATHELPADLHVVWDERVGTLKGGPLDDIERRVEEELGTNQTPRFFQVVLREALRDLSLDLQFMSGRAKLNRQTSLLFGFASGLANPFDFDRIRGTGQS